MHGLVSLSIALPQNTVGFLSFLIFLYFLFFYFLRMYLQYDGGNNGCKLQLGLLSNILVMSWHFGAWPASHNWMLVFGSAGTVWVFGLLALFFFFIVIFLFIKAGCNFVSNANSVPNLPHLCNLSAYPSSVFFNQNQFIQFNGYEI